MPLEGRTGLAMSLGGLWSDEVARAGNKQLGPAEVVGFGSTTDLFFNLGQIMQEKVSSEPK